MAEPKSPFPEGTTESVIYLDADRKVVPADPDGSAPASAVQGEVTVTDKDGRVLQHTTFSLNGEPPQYD